MIDKLQEGPSQSDKCSEFQQQLTQIANVIRENKDRTVIAKTLFTLIPDLESIQKDVRIKVCNQVVLRTLKPGEKLISEEEEIKQFCVLLEGALQHVPVGQYVDLKRTAHRWEKRKQKLAAEQQAENKLEAVAPELQKGILRPGALFGELTHVTQKKWRHATVFALESSSVLVFNNHQLSRAIKEASAKAGFQELLHFLSRIFPDFCTLSSTNQRKIINSFKPVEFLPGQALIKEGEIGDKAYLIKEGQCSMWSSKNPLTAFSDQNNVDVRLKTKRGFLSYSTNTLQLGTLESNQWAGEERLVSKEEGPFDYSIIAKTHVRAYEITRQDARRKLPTELMAYLVKVANQRFCWIEQRTRYLIKKVREVASMDPSKEKYDENLMEFHKKYPAANPYVITNIRKKHLLIKSASTTTKILPRVVETPEVTKPTINIPKEAFDTMKPQRNNTSLPPSRVVMSTTLPTPSKHSFLNLRTTNTSFQYNKTMNDFTNLQNAPYKMDIASSTPRVLEHSKLVPTFSKSFGSSQALRLSAAKASTVLSSRGANATLPVEMSETMNQFSVGCRTIMLLSQLHGHRPNTPKVNYLAKARYKPSY